MLRRAVAPKGERFNTPVVDGSGFVLAEKNLPPSFGGRFFFRKVFPIFLRHELALEPWVLPRPDGDGVEILFPQVAECFLPAGGGDSFGEPEVGDAPEARSVDSGFSPPEVVNDPFFVP